MSVQNGAYYATNSKGGNKVEECTFRYVTIVGMKYKYGVDFIDVGDKVTIKAELDNPKDREAVVVMYGDKPIGYIANSVDTNIRGCTSAGAIRELLGDRTAEGCVLFRLDECAIAQVAICKEV
jgi:hypothetical protein